MSTVQKISIALPPKMAANLKKAVAKGGYSSTSEVVREALRDWDEKQMRKAAQLKKLREMIQEGIDCGIAEDFSMEDVKRQGRERLADQFKKSA